MSRALTRARERYEATPRKLDDDEAMTRLARGDRGCLGDAMSAVGAVTLMVLLVLVGTGKLAFAWVYIGVALFVGGFFTGVVHQSRSGRERQAALESGPLAVGVVLRAVEHLRRPGKRVGRAVVLIAPSGARSLDRAWLEGAVASLETWLDSGSASGAGLRELIAEEERFAIVPVPDAALPEHDAGPVYLASVFVHPEHLEGSYLGAEEDEAAEAEDADLDAPVRPAAIPVIVDVERNFIEQVPSP